MFGFDKLKISIHAPLTGRDLMHIRDIPNPLAFQSTRPLRGATSMDSIKGSRSVNFNPRAPYGARPVCARLHLVIRRFQSTRPLRGATFKQCETAYKAAVFQSTRPLRGATMARSIGVERVEVFQSTRPLRGATMAPNSSILLMDISIHAPLTGRDDNTLVLTKDASIISIHAPLTGRDEPSPLL